MALIQSLVDPSKYDVKCPYNMSPIGICIHNTANDASAKNEISYLKSNNNEVSYHIAIDDVEAIQVIPFDRNAWAAGDGGSGNGNRKYIHIEICYSKSGGSRFIEAEKRTAKEVAALLKRYGWNISNVKKHQDFSGKYCPHRTLDMGWQRFLDMISAELKALNGGASSSSSNSSSSSSVYPNAPSTSGSGSSYPEKGVFHFNTSVKIRTAPSISESTYTGLCYDAGENVTYHTVHLDKDGHNWIQYLRGNGTQGYCAVRDLATGERFGHAT